MCSSGYVCVGIQYKAPTEPSFQMTLGFVREGIGAKWFFSHSECREWSAHVGRSELHQSELPLEEAEMFPKRVTLAPATGLPSPRTATFVHMAHPHISGERNRHPQYPTATARFHNMKSAKPFPTAI